MKQTNRDKRIERARTIFKIRIEQLKDYIDRNEVLQANLRRHESDEISCDGLKLSSSEIYRRLGMADDTLELNMVLLKGIR